MLVFTKGNIARVRNCRDITLLIVLKNLKSREKLGKNWNRVGIFFKLRSLKNWKKVKKKFKKFKKVEKKLKKS